MSEPLNIYTLSRDWWNFCFINPDKIRPNHTALYFFAIEHCNRLGWKRKFGLPTTMAMEAIGIRSYNTFAETMADLIEWGFIIMHERSRNQWSANVVELLRNDKKKRVDDALDRSLIKHRNKKSPIKKSESTVQSTSESNSESTVQSTHQSSVSIDKQVYKNTNLQGTQELPFDSEEFRTAWQDLLREKKWRKKSPRAIGMALKKLARFPLEEALQMIENTVAGEWQGIFELDDRQRRAMKPAPGGQTSMSRTAKNSAVLTNVLNQMNQ